MDRTEGKQVNDLYKIAEMIYKNQTNSSENNIKTGIDRVYNRIKTVCTSIMSMDDSVSFDLNQFNKQEIVEFLGDLIYLLDSQNPQIGNNKNKEQKNPNRKMIYNIANGDVDLDINNLIVSFMKKGYSRSKCNSNSFVPKFYYDKQQRIVEMNKFTDEQRWIIRHVTTMSDKEKIIKCMDNVFVYINESLNSLNEERNGEMYNPMIALHVITYIIQLFNDVFFQIMQYLIIANEKYSKEKKLDILNSILSRAKEIGNEFDPKCDKAEKFNIFWSFAVYLGYLEKRNELVTYVEVLNLLTEQMEKEDYICEIPDEFQCKEHYLKDFKTKKEYRNIILEGKEEKEERFNERMNDCTDLCKQLFVMAGRELCPDYLQHIKVVYREIIEDPLKYNGKQSRTILRNFEKKETPYFDSIKEFYFCT